MRSTNVKPISYLKANAAKVLQDLTENLEIEAGNVTPVVEVARRLKAKKTAAA
jgi:hypothetical protein